MRARFLATLAASAAVLLVPGTAWAASGPGGGTGGGTGGGGTAPAPCITLFNFSNAVTPGLGGFDDIATSVSLDSACTAGNFVTEKVTYTNNLTGVVEYTDGIQALTKFVGVGVTYQYLQAAPATPYTVLLTVTDAHGVLVYKTSAVVNTP